MKNLLMKYFSTKFLRTTLREFWWRHDVTLRARTFVDVGGVGVARDREKFLIDFSRDEKMTTPTWRDLNIAMDRGGGKLHSGKWPCLQNGRLALVVPVLMTFLLLAAFYKNQQFLDENPPNFFANKFVSPEELRFDNDQFVVIAVVLKGEL